MSRTIIIALGLACAVIAAAGIMYYPPSHVAPIPSNPIREVQYKAGPDGIWFTTDDVINDYTLYIYQ